MFPSNLPKCLKWLQNRKLFVYFVVGFRYFSHNFRWVSLYSGFCKVKFNRLLTLQAKISRIPKSAFPYLGRHFSLVPRALFPGFGGGAAPSPKPWKSALGTRLATLGKVLKTLLNKKAKNIVLVRSFELGTWLIFAKKF